MRQMNKKAAVGVIIWGIAALLGGLGFLVNQTKPEPTGIAAVPVWGWVIGGLVILILLRR